MPAVAERDWPVRPTAAMTVIAILSELLFVWNVWIPHKLVFDETHYVPAARALIALEIPRNIEHPLVAKEFIALGILIFGDNSFGWRFFSTLAGTATVLGVFWICWLLFRRTKTAVLGAIFSLLVFTVYIQARIAMLDGFMAAFVVTGIAVLLWAMDAPPRRAWPRWLLGAALLGLGVGAKWAVIPFVAYAGLAFLVVRICDARAAGKPLLSALGGKDQPHWPGMATIPALLALGLVSIAVYLATFTPAFFYKVDPLTLASLLPFQLTMYHEQTQVLASHPYQSNWYTWPFMIRPIWYLYEWADGAQRGVLLLGNPAIMWGGLVAVLVCLYGGRRNPRLLIAGLLWVGSYIVWAIIPKSLGFFYYYYLPSIFLCVALAGAFDHSRKTLRYWDEGFTILAFGLAVYFFPIISSQPLSGPDAFLHWMWFSTWP